eukprot:c38905_g1_i1.p1 GENE.c38905_g1_i1~~c38905_g1_i1.p1  ORF type:complete len:532 (-),score=87.07 c38905_g1_i1:46-1641(-)
MAQRSLAVTVVAFAALIALVGATPQQAACGYFRACTTTADCNAYANVIGDGPLPLACCGGQCVQAESLFIGDLAGSCVGTCSSGVALNELSAYNGRCERPVYATGRHSVPPSSQTYGCPCMQDGDCISGNCKKTLNSDPFGNCTTLLPAAAPCTSNIVGNNMCATSVCTNDTRLCTGLALNQPCTQSTNNFPCADGLYCALNNALNFVCKQLAAAGEVCQSNRDCGANLYCNATTTGTCQEKYLGLAGEQCTQNYGCKSKRCGTVNGQLVCLSSFGDKYQNQPCPEGDANCAPGYACTGTVKSFINIFSNVASTTPVCKAFAGYACADNSDCGPMGQCQCTGGASLPTCVSKPLPVCQDEQLEYQRYTGGSIYQIGSLSMDLSFPFTLAPMPVQTAVAAYLCCQCRNDPVPYAELANGNLVQRTLSVKAVCTATPTLVARPASSSGQCKPATLIPLNDVLSGCRAAPSPPQKSAWAKAKVPVIVTVCVVGGVIIIGAIVAVILKGAGGGGAGKVAKEVAMAPVQAPKASQG